MDVMHLLLGAIAAAGIAGLAWRRRSLTADGAVAAVIVGTVVVAGGGWWWGVLLVSFFVSASALSRWRPRPARRLDGPEVWDDFRNTVRDENRAARGPAGSMPRRGARRDAVQVFANGGVATLLAALALLSTGGRLWLFALFAGAIAAATADTWATEIGRRSRVRPRLITSGQPVPPGVSGGVTPLGTAASALGAGLIGGLAALGAALGWVASPLPPLALCLGVALAGFAGALGDSLLGATAQASYTDAVTGAITEHPRQPAGSPNPLRHGWPWVTNDVVNVAATIIGAGVAGLAALIASGGG